MKYIQIEVIETLREHPNSSLWNKVIKNWTDEDKREYLKLKYGIVKPKKVINYKDGLHHSCKKVVRISDNTIYSSLSECAKMNDIGQQVVSNHVRKLVDNPLFKYHI